MAGATHHAGVCSARGPKALMIEPSYPPVPQRLRDKLKDHPELIERLQRALNSVVDRPSSAIPSSERTFWILEGTLDSFVAEAKKELQSAKAGGDTPAIEIAMAKVSLMRRARSPNGGMADLHDLWVFFEPERRRARASFQRNQHRMLGRRSRTNSVSKAAIAAATIILIVFLGQSCSRCFQRQASEQNLKRHEQLMEHMRLGGEGMQAPYVISKSGKVATPVIEFRRSSVVRVDSPAVR